MSANLSVRGLVSGLYGRKEIDLQLVNTGAGGHQTAPVSLTAGVDATFTVPQGAKGIILIPAVNNTTPWRIKGAPGDTGILQNPTLPTIVCVDTTSAAVDVIVRPTGAPLVLESVQF